MVVPHGFAVVSHGFGAGGAPGDGAGVGPAAMVVPHGFAVVSHGFGAGVGAGVGAGFASIDTTVVSGYVAEIPAAAICSDNILESVATSELLIFCAISSALPSGASIV